MIAPPLATNPIARTSRPRTGRTDRPRKSMKICAPGRIRTGLQFPLAGRRQGSLDDSYNRHRPGRPQYVDAASRRDARQGLSVERRSGRGPTLSCASGQTARHDWTLDVECAGGVLRGLPLAGRASERLRVGRDGVSAVFWGGHARAGPRNSGCCARETPRAEWLGTTLLDNGQQWDRPNGWAPMQYLAIQGLSKNGERDLGLRNCRSLAAQEYTGLLSHGSAGGEVRRRARARAAQPRRWRRRRI